MDISNELILFEDLKKGRGWDFWFQCFQKFFTFLILIVFSPLMLLTIIAIKLDDPKGKIFYKGKRLGLYGKVFYMFKFRTLKEDSECKIGAALLSKNSSYITNIGKILRFTKLDELPQFINVFLGDMNIIGPRPIRPILAREYEKNIINYPLRFQVKPGLSGLAQVFGDYYTPPEQKLKYELEYIRNQEIGYDLRLIYLTVYTILNSVVDKILRKIPIKKPSLKTLTLRLQKAANFLLIFLSGI
ncbi:sugar transferase [Candidatus Dependentiae bacterium]|nr:sugar transferase [Candidatus Dependentiae bacterium]